MNSNFYKMNAISGGVKMLAFLSILIFGQSCLNRETDFEKLQKQQDELITEFLASSGLEAEKSEVGIYFLPVKENPGGREIKSGEIVSVYYTLRELNGKVIDTLEAEYEHMPLKFAHGKNALKPLGADYIITKMKKGERYRVFIPSYVEYGINVPSIVSSNGVVDLEIEVVDVITEKEQMLVDDELLKEYIAAHELTNVDSLEDGLYYKMLRPGDGNAPRNGNYLSVHYTGKLLSGKVFDSTKDKPTFKFYLGEARVIKGWDRGFLKMTKGEKGLLIIPSHLAYGVYSATNLPNELLPFGASIPKKIDNIEVVIPAFSPLVFEVELVSL